MNRALMTALTAGLLAGVAGGLPDNVEASPASHLRSAGKPEQIEGWRWNECRMNGLEPGSWTAREERLTTVCILDRWSVPGGTAKFQSVIACESGWNRFAYNPRGPYVGLGQHVLSAWPDRVRSYTPANWSLRPSWSNSRTMLTITARMMHAVGLSPWSCA